MKKFKKLKKCVEIIIDILPLGGVILNMIKASVNSEVFLQLRNMPGKTAIVDFGKGAYHKKDGTAIYNAVSNLPDIKQ